jgi:hypothetical protein
MRTDTPEQLRELIDRGAEPVALSEIADRRATAPAGPHHLAQGRGLARRRATARLRAATALRTGWAAAAAAGIVALGCAGAVTAAQLSSPAGNGHQGRGPGRMQVLLTARMVNQLARASETALASAGHVLITTDQAGVSSMADRPSSLSEDLTFSGANYNYVVRNSSSRPGGPLTSRVVDGQLYLRGPVLDQKPHRWLHIGSSPRFGHPPVPQPGKLLNVLRPSAHFVSLGWQVIDGVRVQHLRATDLRSLPSSLLTVQPGLRHEHLTGLNVWADASGVVREMRMTAAGAYAGVPRHATVSVRFLDIGRPEIITAPRHFTDVTTSTIPRHPNHATNSTPSA